MTQTENYGKERTNCEEMAHGEEPGCSQRRREPRAEQQPLSSALLQRRAQVQARLRMESLAAAASCAPSS